MFFNSDGSVIGVCVSGHIQEGFRGHTSLHSHCNNNKISAAVWLINRSEDELSSRQ